MPTELPRVLILCYTPVARSPRVLKQVAEFRGAYHVVTAGYGPAPDGVAEHIELVYPPRVTGWARVPGVFTLLLALRLHRLYAKLEPLDASAYARLKDMEWDVIVAHDAQTLSVASRLASRTGVLADLHEYSPEQNERSLRWLLLDRPYFVWLCRTFATQARHVTTVSSGIVDAYRSNFGINAQLVVNATPYAAFEPTKTGTPIRMVHSGVAAPDRRLEVLVDAVISSRANVTLDLYLLDGVEGYIDNLRDRSRGDARVSFRPAVPYSQLIETLSAYDVGVHVIAPTSFNNEWSLPNKFFDYIQARLGVIIGPSPAMVEYVERYGLGAVSADFGAQSLASVLEALDPEMVNTWKQASDSVARELSGEEQARVWGRIVKDMLRS